MMAWNWERNSIPKDDLAEAAATFAVAAEANQRWAQSWD
jgi:hypothetical protein